MNWVMLYFAIGILTVTLALEIYGVREELKRIARALEKKAEEEKQRNRS